MVKSTKSQTYSHRAENPPGVFIKVRWFRCWSERVPDKDYLRETPLLLSLSSQWKSNSWTERGGGVSSRVEAVRWPGPLPWNFPVQDGKTVAWETQPARSLLWRHTTTVWVGNVRFINVYVVQFTFMYFRFQTLFKTLISIHFISKFIFDLLYFNIYFRELLYSQSFCIPLYIKRFFFIMYTVCSR